MTSCLSYPILERPSDHKKVRLDMEFRLIELESVNSSINWIIAPESLRLNQLRFCEMSS